VEIVCSPKCVHLPTPSPYGFLLVKTQEVVVLQVLILLLQINRTTTRVCATVVLLFVHIPFLSFLKEKEVLQQEKFRLPFRSYYFGQIKRNNNYQSRL
jgi:hypothetical protein